MSTLISQAEACFHAGRLDDAAALCRKVLTSNPKDTAALHLLGIVRWRQGDAKDAVEHLRKAAARSPASADIQTLLGVILQEGHDAEKAVRHFQRAFEIDPTRPAHMSNYGYTLALLGRDLDRAETLLRRAAAAEPRNAAFRRNLAHLLERADRPAEALVEAEAALAVDPSFPEALITATLVLRRLGRLPEVLPHFDRAQRAAPHDAEVHWNRALVHLLLGDLPRGWQGAEWRFQAHQVAASVYPQPRWDGSAAPHATLLVHHEQGFGDTLQFIRYVPRLRERVGRVVFVAQRPLVRLLEGFDGIDELVEGRTDRPVAVHADLQVSLLSLPGIFQTTLENIPATIPYLQARERWTLPEGCRVGLAWEGSAEHKANRARSCQLMDFAPLADIPGVTFYSLQLGAAGRQAPPPGMRLIDWTARLHDFADTAGLVANLDLVIAVDTAVVHLAGALGVPTWSLHAFHGDWRWLLERDDSPWYPGMRLFRQPKPGDWASVMRQVAEALLCRVPESAPQRGRQDAGESPRSGRQNADGAALPLLA